MLQNLFVAGEGPYFHYRIPGLVVTPGGRVLAYCEARYDHGGDWAPSDILMRASDDNGVTWTGPQCLAAHADYGPSCMNNPVAISDRITGSVHFLYCHDYGRAFYRCSHDDGDTFSEPVEITPTFETFRAIYPWTVLAIGPGHGIQLASGRLLAPVWLSASEARAHEPNRAAVIYSDDHGQSWQAGEMVPDNIPCCNETVAVELDSGEVLLNMRNKGEAQRRAMTTSPDGIGPWRPPRYDRALPEPQCFGSICKYTHSEMRTRAETRILFVNPDTLPPAEASPGQGGERRNLTLRISYDNAQSWPVSRVIDAGPSGYADLTVAPDGHVLCLYERGQRVGSQGGIADLTLARLDIAWLEAKE